jgi:hypothetical protein
VVDERHVGARHGLDGQLVASRGIGQRLHDTSDVLLVQVAVADEQQAAPLTDQHRFGEADSAETSRPGEAERRDARGLGEKSPHRVTVHARHDARIVVRDERAGKWDEP